MSRTSEILQKAQSLRQKHQEDIDSELKNGIRLALNDTKNFVKQRANTILNDMETEIEKVETDLTQNLQNQKTEMQSKIGKVASSFNSNTQVLNMDLQKQIQDMKLHLQTLQSLSQETIEQAKLKKALTLSIFPLILVLLILLISNMFLGYINKTNYKELNQIKTLQQTEQAKLAEVKQALSLSKAELQKKYPQIAFKD